MSTATKQLLAMQSPVADREDWETPAHIFDPLNDEFDFNLDAAATADNTKAIMHYGPADNSIDLGWAEYGRVWCNPPYGREIPKWVEKAYAESLRGATVVMLVPARTDTRWWHEFVIPFAEVRFVRGRIKFVGARYNAPFPSAIVIFRPAEARP